MSYDAFAFPAGIVKMGGGIILSDYGLAHALIYPLRKLLGRVSLLADRSSDCIDQKQVTIASMDKRLSTALCQRTELQLVTMN